MTSTHNLPDQEVATSPWVPSGAPQVLANPVVIERCGFRRLGWVGRRSFP